MQAYLKHFAAVRLLAAQMGEMPQLPTVASIGHQSSAHGAVQANLAGAVSWMRSCIKQRPRLRMQVNVALPLIIASLSMPCGQMLSISDHMSAVGSMKCISFKKGTTKAFYMHRLLHGNLLSYLRQQYTDGCENGAGPCHWLAVLGRRFVAASGPTAQVKCLGCSIHPNHWGLGWDGSNVSHAPGSNLMCMGAMSNSCHDPCSCAW